VVNIYLGTTEVIVDLGIKHIYTMCVWRLGGGGDTFVLKNGPGRGGGGAPSCCPKSAAAGGGGGALLVCEVVQGVVTPICTALTVKTGVRKFFYRHFYCLTV